MRNLVDFNAVNLLDAPADHIMPGDWFDTRCGIGAYAYARVVSVRYIDDNRRNGKDRVELTFDTPAGSWCVTREMFVDTPTRFGRPC